MIFAHRRPIIMKREVGGIGFIDWSSIRYQKVDDISANGEQTYSYQSSNKPSWIFFNHTSTTNTLGAQSPIIKLNNNMIYLDNTHVDGTNSPYCYRVRGTICLPLDRDDVLSFTSYKFKENNVIGYTVFDELQDGHSVGFIGETIESGNIKASQNIKEPASIHTVNEDCWLYLQYENPDMLFCNSGVDISNPDNWVMPFSWLTTSKVVHSTFGCIQNKDEFSTRGTNTNSLLIPLRAGQRFTTAFRGTKSGTYTSSNLTNYSLYKMVSSWDSPLARIDFNNAIFEPVIKFDSNNFTYTANTECWAFVTAQHSDKWTLDGKDIFCRNGKFAKPQYTSFTSCAVDSSTSTIVNSPNARYGKYIPLKTGQTLNFTGSITNNTKWGTKANDYTRFAVYKMKS